MKELTHGDIPHILGWYAGYLRTIRFRWGRTVSDKQRVVQTWRKEFRTDDRTHIEVFPGFRDPKDERKNDLALIFLGESLRTKPRFLNGDLHPLKPIPIIRREEGGLVMKSHFYSFGHGNAWQEPADADIPMSQYELDKSSGFLRWSYLKLVGINSGLLNFHLAGQKAIVNELRKLVPPHTAWIEGPCRKSDAGAPVLLTEERPEPRAAVIGLFHDGEGGCQRAGKVATPNFQFVDLRERDYQAWFEKWIWS